MINLQGVLFEGNEGTTVLSSQATLVLRDSNIIEDGVSRNKPKIAARIKEQVVQRPKLEPARSDSRSVTEIIKEMRTRAKENVQTSEQSEEEATVTSGVCNSHQVPGSESNTAPKFQLISKGKST